MFAKLGSDLKKPDATTLISRENYRELVWPLPVRDLLYVGKAAAEELERHVIRTIGDLARFDRDGLVRILGKAAARFGAMPTGWTTSLCAASASRSRLSRSATV